MKCITVSKVLTTIFLISPLLANADNSCDSAELIRQYDAGELSITRDSTLFQHKIRVTRFCDAGRPVDIEDLFAQIDATETKFHELFGRSISFGDGKDQDDVPLILEVLIGICEVDDGAVDCAIGDFCSVKLGWTSDRICQDFAGRSYNRPRNDNTREPHTAAHLAVVPWLAEGKPVWVKTNRYGNLHHEYTHLLDFTYIRVEAGYGHHGWDSWWWVEGLAQYIQWKILGDDISWIRGNDKATLIGSMTGQEGTRTYYDGMRVIAYLAEHAPWQLERAAFALRSGVYSTAGSHLEWHDWIGHVAWRHQHAFENWKTNRHVGLEQTDLRLLLQTPTPDMRVQ